MTEANDIVLARSGQPTDLISPDQEVQPGSLAPVLQRRWRTAVLVTALAAAASCSAIWGLMRPKYEVSATVHVAPVVPPILFSDADTDISRSYSIHVATQARVMTSPAVIQDTLNVPEVRSLPSILQAEDPAEEIRRRLTVEQVRRTELLEVTMVGEAPQDMAVIVNALLSTYLRQRDDKRRASDERILSSLRAEQAELQARLEAKSVELRQLSVDSGSGVAEAAGTAIDAHVTEIQQLLTQANRDRALAVAKLEALDASDKERPLADEDPGGFEEYVRTDPESQSLRDQLRSLELAAFDDDRLGRGPEYPGLGGRPEQMAAVQKKLEMRESRLRELYEASVRRRLEGQRLDAEIAAKVLQEELDRLAHRRADVARQVFVLDDVRHERERLEEALARVRQKIWNVEVEQNRMARVTIDSPAIAPEKPNNKKRIKYTAAACVMSLFLGAGAALVRHRLDTSVHEPGEVTERLGLRLLGSVQRVPNTNGMGLVGDERMLEPLRGISTALLAASRTRRAHSRLVTSPTPRSGKSSLAMNLARSLASAGRRVLLVDADNSGQGVTRAFEMTGRPGFRELLEGTSQAEQVVHPSDVANLHVTPAGQHDAQFGGILIGQRAQQNARSLFGAYDEVIVDSPPVLASSNAVVLATLVDEVILVLRAGESTREEAHAACRCLDAVGSKLVGVILNAVDPKNSPYYYSGYAYSKSGGKGARKS